MNGARAHTQGQLEIFEADEAIHVIVSGSLGIRDLAHVDSVLQAVDGTLPVTFDFSRAERIDTAIAWAVASARRRFAATDVASEVIGASPNTSRILETVEKALPTAEPAPDRPFWLTAMVTRVGESVVDSVRQLTGFMAVLGLFLLRSVQTPFHPRQFRLTALVHHCEAVGVRAVPIVSLMAFLIGVVLAFQGAAQLRQFGAEIFVVDLIAISILRELGILLTAIIVAGRTASAFTAAIGSMKMREEIDAMHTLGIDPGHALIVPRILALILMLPILGLIANCAGLLGGALMSWIELGISPAMFTTRLIEGTAFSNVFVGFAKAPVFAVLIGVIGCQAGLQVGKTAESLGRMTSSAVVAAIFAVILADAVFSIFFEKVGL